jgi:hypothetical protein
MSLKRRILIIEKQEPRLAALVKNDLSKYLKYYFYAGGVPEVALAFTREKKLIPYAPYKKGLSATTKMIFQSTPTQYPPKR